MKKITKLMLLVVLACCTFIFAEDKAEAVNPVVQDVYTADPAPMVCSDGRVYLYTSHDEDETINNFFSMNDWKCYSSDDMVNWTDHGTVLSYHEFDWAKENSSWAGQVVERDGKFYFYVPINAKNGVTAIGVAVSDSPTGPFVDPIGEPLIGPSYNYIDPTVWIDDDGKAYLYWGNPDLCCVVLNDDMISYDKSYGDNGIIKWELETKDYADLESKECKNVQEQFGVGTRMDGDTLRRPTLYEEGPWFYKHGDYYYLAYAANGIPERLDYSMATSPLGPWKYAGMIMDDNVDGEGTGSFTNHPGIIDYKGRSYLFYHTGKLHDGGGYHRSVAIEEITYNEDGTINPVDFTDDGVEPINSLNPYDRVEAETIEYSNSFKASGSDRLGKYGVEKEPCSNGGINLCDINNGDYICIRNVDFTQRGAIKFTACTSAEVAKDVVAGRIGLYLDGPDGEWVGDIEVKGGDSKDSWVTNSIAVDKTSVNGVHDLYMVFTGDDLKESLFKFDYWQFEKEPEPTPAPTVAPTVAPPATQPTVAPTSAPTAAPVAQPVVKPAKVKSFVVKALKGKKAKLSWKKVSNAEGYEIVFTTNSKFKKALKKVNVKKLSTTIKKLKKGKTYYFKVRAYVKDSEGKKVYGSYSAKKKIKIKK